MEGLRATSTYYSDILVDEPLAEELVGAAHTLPPMSGRSTGIERADIGLTCGRGGYANKMDDPTRLAYLPRDLDATGDVNLTWEWFGPYRFEGTVSDALFAYPWFLVTPKVRRIFYEGRCFLV